MEPVLEPPPGFTNGPIKDECYETASGISRRVLDKGKTKCQLPVEDFTLYAAVVIDDDGNVYYRTSPCLKSEKEDILRPAADRLVMTWNMLQQRQGGGHCQQRSTKKGAKRSGSPTFANSPVAQASIPIPYSSLPSQKRRRFGEQQTHTDLSMVHSPSSKRLGSTSQPESSQTAPTRAGKPSASGFSMPPMRQIEVQDTDAIANWMHEAFAAVQQQACRLLAKEWIKLIQPKKQSTNPYNGKRAGMENPSPELTKPVYWPPGVEHKEPDHLKSPGRTALLTHLMMNTPQKEIRPNSGEGVNFGKDLYAMDLLNVLDWDKSNDLKNKRDIIENIVTVRGMVENYNEGGIDGSTGFSVPCYKEKPRKKSETNRQAADSAEKKANGLVEMQPQAHEIVNLADSSWDQMTELASSTCTSPFDTGETPPATDDQDQNALLNMSFTSTATGLSSALSSSSPSAALRTRQPSQTTLDGHSNSTNQARRGTVILANADLQANRTTYSQIPHPMQAQPTWTSGVALGPDAFPPDDMMTLLENQSSYNSGLRMSHHPTSLLGSMHPPLELQDSHAYGAYFINGAGMMVPCRPVHELSNTMQASPEQFGIAAAYYDAHYQQQSQHLRHP